MDKLLHYRFFRFLVCIVLVCAILINCSPVKAQATEIGIGVTGIGVLFWFMLMFGGMVIEPTQDVLNDLDRAGQAYIDDWIVQAADDAAAASEALRKAEADLSEWISDPSNFTGDSSGESGGDDSGDPDWGVHWDENGNIVLGSMLGGALARWFADSILADGVEVEEELSVDDSTLWVDSLTISANGKEYNFSDGLFFPVPIAYRYIYTDSGGTVRYYWYNQIISSSSPVVLNKSYSYGKQYAIRLYGHNLASHGSTDPGDRWDSYCPEGYIDLGTFHVSKVEEVAPLVVEAFYASSISNTVSVHPETYVGEIPSQVETGTYDPDRISFPAFDFSRVLSNQESALQEMRNLYQQIRDNQMSYEDFVQQIQAVPPVVDPDSPSVDPSEPGETTPEETEPDEEDDEDKDLDMFSLDLSDYFPFCIPFDLYDFFTCLNADPVAPVIEWFVPLPGGGKYPLRIDLSAYDDVAQLLRRLQLLLFCVGLAFKTRDLIKG